jgi:hypothetical protein
VDGISEGGGGRDPQVEAEQVKRGGGGRRGAEGVGRVRVGGWFCIIIKVVDGEVGLITLSGNTWSLHKCVYFRCCFERYANKLFDSFEGPDKLCCSF